MSGASAQRPSASKTRFSARLANKNTPTSQDNYDSDSESASSESGVDGNGSDICTGEDYTTEDMDESKEGNPMKGPLRTSVGLRFLELESYICYCEEQSFRVSQNDLPVEHDSRCKVLDYFGMVFLEHLRVLYCPTRNRITPMSEWAAHIKGSHVDWMSANKIKDCDSMAKHVADSHNLSMKSTFKDLDLPNEIDNPLSTKTKNLTFSYQCPICDLWTATDKDSNQPDRYTRRHLQTKCLQEAGDDYKTIGLSKPRWIVKLYSTILVLDTNHSPFFPLHGHLGLSSKAYPGRLSYPSPQSWSSMYSLQIAATHLPSPPYPAQSFDTLQREAKRGGAAWTGRAVPPKAQAVNPEKKSPPPPPRQNAKVQPPLSPLRSPERIKVGDFVLAALIESPGEGKKSICGTPNHVAPDVPFDGHGFEVNTWPIGHMIGVILCTFVIGRPDRGMSRKYTSASTIINTNFRPTEMPRLMMRASLCGRSSHPNPQERPTLHNIVDRHTSLACDRHVTLMKRSRRAWVARRKVERLYRDDCESFAWDGKEIRNAPLSKLNALNYRECFEKKLGILRTIASITATRPYESFCWLLKYYWRTGLMFMDQSGGGCYTNPATCKGQDHEVEFFFRRQLCFPQDGGEGLLRPGWRHPGRNISVLKRRELGGECASDVGSGM
ncbi:hypothetical protein BJV77DRAFT_963577 [Russula vinacea]|nr:hypothetical protein BJV77DRAFT_963577 [Russula vinacea]